MKNSKSNRHPHNKQNSISSASNTILNLIFIFWSAMCIVPFLLVLGISFSSESSITLEGYRIIPSEFSTLAYEYIFKKTTMLLKAYGVTIGTTISGTILSLAIITLFAYPLSRKYFKLRNFFSFIVFFTMIFQGGAVASYMVYTQVLGLKNNYLAYITPTLMNAWNVILMRTFITISVPDELVDAAKIDGAGELKTFWSIVIPLCKPGMATIALFTAINLWNDWYTPSLYITDSSMHNLQYMLYSMLSNIQYLKSNIGRVGNASLLLSEMPAESVRMAMCIITIGPIVLAYPFFQKYFVKGLTVGAVKG